MPVTTIHTMNKLLRTHLRERHFKRRLRDLGLVGEPFATVKHYKDQGKPCSCAMCSRGKELPHKPKFSVRKRMLSD